MISSQVFSFYQHEPGFILKSLNTIKIHLKYRVPFLKKVVWMVEEEFFQMKGQS